MTTANAAGKQLRSKRARIPQVDGAGDEDEARLGNMMTSARSDALVDEESLFDSWLTEPDALAGNFSSATQ